MITIEKVARSYRVGNGLTNIIGYGTPIFGALINYGNTKVQDISTTAPDTSQLSSTQQILTLLTRACYEQQLFIYTLLALVMILATILKTKGDDLIWRALQRHVDSLKQAAFSDARNHERYNHRVTLFKHKWWSLRPIKDLCFPSIERKAWPWSGWLYPVIRSGHTGKNTQAIFLAPDDPKHAEGIAGKAWSEDAIVFQNELPFITEKVSEELRNEYCTDTNMPRWMLESYIRKNKNLARCFMATPVKTDTGRLWGVIVFDTPDRNGLDEEKTTKAFQIAAEPIGELIKRV